MDHPSSKQSRSDHKTEAECSQSQISDPKNDTPTSIDQGLCIEHEQTNDTLTEPRIAEQSIHDANLRVAIELSLEAGRVSPVTIPGATIHESQPLIESGEPAVPVTSYARENFQRIVTDDGQQNGSSIDHSIVFTTSTVQTKKGKKKQKLPKFPIHMKDEPSKLIEDEPSKPIQDDVQIPEGSTDLIFGAQIISVNVEQLYGTPMIGHGNFGSVYSVIINGSPDIPMAVKRVSRGMANEVTTMKLVASGGCQYIIDYYGALINPGSDELCMCMEFMDASLETFCRTMHPLDAFSSDHLNTFVHRVAHDIAFGLYYLEIKQIVHRDIKPANMLINKNAVVKLCDFGISRTFSERKVEEDRILGTANYMPLTLTHTIQDDMWALGISLLEIINGKNPFHDWNSYGQAFGILRWTPSVPTTISVDMHELILQLLEKQPQQRPGSYVDILDKPCIRKTAQMPSNDECDFVRHVIENIHPTDTPDDQLAHCITNKTNV